AAFLYAGPEVLRDAWWLQPRVFVSSVLVSGPSPSGWPTLRAYAARHEQTGRGLVPHTRDTPVHARCLADPRRTTDLPKATNHSRTEREAEQPVPPAAWS